MKTIRILIAAVTILSASMISAQYALSKHPTE